MRVAPVRYTDDLPAMSRFLTALGLRADVHSESGTWTSLSAPAGGNVALHAAGATESDVAPGTTELSFESTEPLEALRARLAAAGFECSIVDETFGRSLRVVDPDGVPVQVNEAMTDLHGYAVTEPDG